MAHPVVLLVVGVLAGIGLALGLPLSGESTGTALLLSLGVALALRSRRRLALPAWGLLLGFAATWASPRPEPLDGRAFRRGDGWMLEGRLVEPLRRHREGWRGRLTHVTLRRGDVRIEPWGDALVTFEPSTTIDALVEGTRLRLRAHVRPVRPLPNPGLGDPMTILLDRGYAITARADPTAAIALVETVEPSLRERLRANFRRVVTSSTSEPTRGLVEAVVLGDQDAVTEHLRDTWRATGLTHLVSISGLHVGLVAWLVVGLTRLLLLRWRWLLRRWPVGHPAALLAIAAAWTYVWIAAGPVPALRSAWMATVVLGARVVDRSPDALSALGLAALVVLLPEPCALLDPSFQLSFVAVGVLLAGAAPTQTVAEAVALPIRGPDESATRPRRALAWLAKVTTEAVLVSVVATVGTLPIVVWHFGQVALAGLVANLIAVPLCNALVVVPGLAVLALAGVGLDTLAGWAVWPATLGTALLDALATGLASVWPPIILGLRAPAAILALSLAVTASFVALRWERARRVALTACVSLVAATALARTEVPHGQLRLTFLSVGHGDATLVRLPDGATMLIDAGGDPTGMRDVGQEVVVPVLRAAGIGALDVVVLTHAHPDHFLGLRAVFETIPVGALWWNGQPSGDPEFARLLTLVEARGTRLVTIGPGSGPVIAFGGAELDVLHPLAGFDGQDHNDRSVVLRLRYGAFSALLTGDVEEPAETWIVERGVDLQATVLKVPHHGSRTSSTEPFLRAVRPALAVAMASDRGRLAFPDLDVETRYQRLGIPLWVTGRSGALEVTTDGVTWWASGIAR